MSLLLAMLACVSQQTTLPDADFDGFTVDVDCDDAEADAFPGAVEFCDGIDNDCSGAIDDGAVDASTFFEDLDGDRFGGEALLGCAAPEGFVSIGGDCDDANPDVHPARGELCNGIDDDCDGRVDAEPVDAVYVDLDGDGFGGVETATFTCTPEAGTIAIGGDCDDADSAIHPDASESCDGIDNDCDGRIDDEDSVVDPTEWFPDADQDGSGTATFSVAQCTPPPGPWSLDADDCDDFDASIGPGAVEYCNGIDDDCDGVVDSPEAPLVAGPRFPLVFSAPEVVDDPVFVVTLDVDAAWVDGGGVGAADPDWVRVVTGDCLAGFREHPSRFLDALDDLGVPGVDGDGVGALIVSYDPDGDPTTSQAFAGSDPGWLHLAPPVLVGGATAAPANLASGRVSADLSEGLLVQTSPFGSTSQGLFQPRVDTPAGALHASGGTVTADSHPAVSRVSVHTESSNGAGSVAFDVEWLVVSGRPEVWVQTRVGALSPTTLFHDNDWRLAVTAFTAGVSGTPLASGDDWVYREATEGVLFRSDGPISVNPGWVAIEGTDVSGPSGPLFEVPAGVVLADSQVMFVADAGLESIERVAELDVAVTLDVGPPAP